jgi:hypothetical protein
MHAHMDCNTFKGAKLGAGKDEIHHNNSYIVFYAAGVQMVDAEQQHAYARLCHLSLSP